MTDVKHVLVVGIGAGHPDHITLQGIDAIRRIDVLFDLPKGERVEDLARARADLLARVRPEGGYRTARAAHPVRDAAEPDYRAGVEAWHGDKAALYEGFLRGEVKDGETAGILAWGDPALYDSTLRILDGLKRRLNIRIEVVPGISAVQALAAAHAIPLHGIGESLLVTTGRRLAAGDGADAANVVVMLDDGSALAALTPDDRLIHWGAYLGTTDEIVLSGPLRQVRDEIVRTRAAARARKGWIMDIYLLQRGVKDWNQSTPRDE